GDRVRALPLARKPAPGQAGARDHHPCADEYGKPLRPPEPERDGQHPEHDSEQYSHSEASIHPRRRQMNSADYRNALAAWTRLQPQIDAVLKAAQDASVFLEDAEQKIDLAQRHVAVFQQREQEAREKTEAVQKLCADAEAKVAQA